MSLFKKMQELNLPYDEALMVIDLGRKYKLHHIEIKFSGGGDDGAIDDVYLCKDADGYEHWEGEEIEGVVHNLEEGEEPDTAAGVHEWLVDFCRSWGVELANEYTTQDWVNNGGGEGTIKIDMETGSISLEARYVSEEYREDVANVIPEELR